MCSQRFPFASHKSLQDGCKENQFPLPLNMGSLDIKPAACPVKSGSTLSIPAVAAVSKTAPNVSASLHKIQPCALAPRLAHGSPYAFFVLIHRSKRALSLAIQAFSA